MLKSVLLDVGGTLWPNAWPESPDDDIERARRLNAAVPALCASDALALVRALSTPHPATLRQQTTSMVAGAVRDLGVREDLPTSVVAAAMCLPARGRVELFPGGRHLLQRLARQDIRVVIASNVVWRDARSYQRDFEELGVAGCVAQYVTSLDVGWRKPHDAFFDAALAAAQASPEECALVGDHEANDILPARARGIYTVQVAIEQPPPTPSKADHVCEALSDVAHLLVDPEVSDPEGLEPPTPSNA